MASLEHALERHRAGQLEQAERLYREILDAHPENADACNLLGLLLSSSSREDEAEPHFAAAVALHPSNVAFLLNYAESLARLGRAEESQAVFQRSLEVDAASPEANARYGLFLAQAGRVAEAEPLMRRSVELKPDEGPYWTNYGNVQRKFGQLDAAVASFETALARAPGNPVALNCLGEALQARGEKERALSLFRQAVAASPGDATPLANLGLALAQSGRLTEALECLEAASAARPNDPLILSSLGAALRDARRFDESLERFERALALAPSDPRVVSKFLYTLNFHPTLAPSEVERARQAINGCYPARPKEAREVPRGEAPLRLAFLSGDFGAHSVAYFLLPLFERVDRSKLRVHCYSEGVASDSITQRFRELADGWRDTAGRSATEVADWIHADRIDVVIDLAGHTAGGRLDVIAQSPAAVAANWLGYPNRVGLATLDFRLVDATTDPAAGSEPSATRERLHPMEGCFLAYQPPYDLPAISPSPCLKNGYITFGSFNNAAKINDSVVAAWSEILRRTSGSMLLLKSWQFEDISIREELLRAFGRRGIEAERLRFSPRLASYAEHMALYGEIDIALDTFPYNGTTTTCEALWMGAPVVSFVGDRHASRVGASLLKAAGLETFLAHSLDEYIEKAVALASRTEMLAARRLGARAKLERSMLGDAADFARRFERAIFGMLQPIASVDRIVEQALAAHRAGRTIEALALYEEAMRRDPSRADARRYAGVALYALERFQEAERLLREACDAFPDQADVFSHWGSALQKLGRSEEAVRAHERALALSPANAVFLSNYGNALVDAGRAKEAALAFRRSLDARGDDARVWTNYSVALKESGQLVRAMEAARRAVGLAPRFVGALSNLGALQVVFGQADEAVATLRAATQLESSSRWAWSNLLYAMQYSDTATLEEIADATRRFGELMGAPLQPAKARAAKEQFRLGFVSADLREHAVARFLLPLLESRGGFSGEIALYHDSGANDAWTRRLRDAGDCWREIVGLSDAEAAALVEGDGIDVLIDLGGHSARNRLGLFALKPAPFQATWLGFPGSTGLKAMDWRIGDLITLTERETALFPEQPLRLPEGFHTIRFEGDAPAATSRPKEGVFAFGSFNNLAKLSARTIRLWARILERAPAARLVLKSYQLEDPEFRALALARFAAAGVEESRIQLLEPARGYAQHLACYGQIDLALDTLPYNGTTTTCEALFMGVPVLALLGERACARVGASLLSAVGLGDFVCESEEAYVEAAVSWAVRPEELGDLRLGLRARLLASALGDAERFAKGFFGAIEARVRAADRIGLKGWIERIAFGEAWTDGEVEHLLGEGILPESFESESALDASCVDGFWAAEAMRRGAASVACLPAPGFWESVEGGRLVFARRDYALATGRLLGLDAARFRVEASPLDRVEAVAAADWIFLNVNANQLADPAGAFAKLGRACRKGLILSLQVRDEGAPATDEEREQGNVWLPTQAELRALLAEAGFVWEAATEYALDAARSWIVLRARVGGRS